ncbi:transcription-repair coupling factor [Eubacterium oxidoreducens]|uniref:Transcription-repair-coupling factor n=1 Tax=Eubacterium oxidoreducens TaxID=1732 RepID=A0A1G6BW59_EUBOX|nr:transcription-repair coupling factor [Eubacterium oxidoreducens]SDB24839.1 transcription-repair coupling factor (superfamily II helicase) [Eubacterium oxidoreducens]
MNVFVKPMEALTQLSEIKEKLKKESGIFQVSGCTDAGKSHLIYTMARTAAVKLLVTYSEQRAKQLLEEYAIYEKNCCYYPARDILFYQSDLKGGLLKDERLRVLRALTSNEKVTVVTTFDALFDRMVRPNDFKESCIELKSGNEEDLEALSSRLTQMGLERVGQVEAPGQFSVRGGIMDIYSMTEEMPYRIEWFGDEIDSIRYFDPESQKSVTFGLDVARIYPASEMCLTEDEKIAGKKKIEKEIFERIELLRREMKTEQAFQLKTIYAELCDELDGLGEGMRIESFLTYFKKETATLTDYFDPLRSIICLDDPIRLMELVATTQEEYTQSMERRIETGNLIEGQLAMRCEFKEVKKKLDAFAVLSLCALETKVKPLAPKAGAMVQMQAVSPYNNSFDLLVKDLKQYRKKNYKILILSGSKTRAENLANDLLEQGLTAFYSEDMNRTVQPKEVMVTYGKLRKGFEYPKAQFVVISESDIFGTTKKKVRRKVRYEGEHISDFSDLKVGDYVVHERYGLGIYRGIEQVKSANTLKDYLLIEYAKEEKLYIQVAQLEALQKYAGRDAKKVKLSKLGGQEWIRTKQKVQSAVLDIAQELVDLYAIRQKEQGYAFGPDTVWQTEFEERFPFEETADQIAAIEDTKRDMESKKIMDRLICGDVGYGKTEIAIRAAFKAVQEHKQVIFLAPTTILAQQHYNTFVQRMGDLGVEIELLCRFRTAAQIKESLKKLKKGTADIVIGTHRVLSKDVELYDLGLLIIDEEQRFGVKHKEAIKQMRKNIDVLTLTATPIPRTLHMSLIGIRDMSVLEEPPIDRLPIQTYVMEYNEEMIREAIQRELLRGGQVYYVFNRVAQIAEVATVIQRIVPDAVVAYAHGRMNERELEDIMYDFMNGEIDILVSTTIIETGLDISNVNTIIIQDADRFGLSQLYQLRGRVGRSARTAYAFLVYKKDRVLKEVARKRLEAIKEYTQLGSGFKIAMKDLEIRGAGNLLGAKQHGHMEAVGYDLYCKMLNEAVARLKGIPVQESFETKIDLKVDAFIPESYIANEKQKLEIYKDIAMLEDEEQSQELIAELIDRFGEVPPSVEMLITIALLKAKAHSCYFTQVRQLEDEIEFTFFEHAKINTAKMAPLLDGFDGALRFGQNAKTPQLIYNRKYSSRQKNETLIEAVTKILDSAVSQLLDFS